MPSDDSEQCDECEALLDDDGLCPHCFDYDRYVVTETEREGGESQ